MHEQGRILSHRLQIPDMGCWWLVAAEFRIVFRLFQQFRGRSKRSVVGAPLSLSITAGTLRDNTALRLGSAVARINRGDLGWANQKAPSGGRTSALRGRLRGGIRVEIGAHTSVHLRSTGMWHARNECMRGLTTAIRFL